MMNIQDGCWRLTQDLAYRVDYHDMKSTNEEMEAGIARGSAAALRLLYTCLTPLEGRDKGKAGSYKQFLFSFPHELKGMLRCDDVLVFLRRALDVPEEEHLMLLLLVDEGNAAMASFPREPGLEPPEVRSLDTSSCSECTYALLCLQASCTCQVVSRQHTCWLLHVHSTRKSAFPPKPTASSAVWTD